MGLRLATGFRGLKPTHSLASVTTYKKWDVTLRVGDEAYHFNLNHSLKQPEFDNVGCKAIEAIVPISSELKYDCKIQSLMNENEKNFQYIESLDVEYLNANCELKETALNLNEISAEKSSSSEEKAQKVEKGFEGLIMKELPKHLTYAFLESERSKPVIIAADLT